MLRVSKVLTPLVLVHNSHWVSKAAPIWVAQTVVREMEVDAALELDINGSQALHDCTEMLKDKKCVSDMESRTQPTVKLVIL